MGDYGTPYCTPEFASVRENDVRRTNNFPQNSSKRVAQPYIPPGPPYVPEKSYAYGSCNPLYKPEISFTMGHTMQYEPKAQAIPTIDQNRTSFIPRGVPIPIYRDQLSITGKYQNHHLHLSFRNEHNY